MLLESRQRTKFSIEYRASREVFSLPENGVRHRAEARVVQLSFAALHFSH